MLHNYPFTKEFGEVVSPGHPDKLADAIAVSRKTISTVETGRFIPSVIIALKIAAHFEVAVEQLFTLDDND